MGTEISNINVAVTGLSATDNPYPGLGIARCLKLADDFRGTITGLVFEPLSTGVFSEGIIDYAYIVPYPAAGHDALLNRIEEIHRKTPLDVIIPALDSEVLLYARLQEGLKDLGIRLLLPPASQVKLRAKNLLYEFGLKNGIDVPKTLILNNVEEIRSKSADIGIPFILKGVLSDARICSSVEEGETEYGSLFESWGYPVLMQHYITGDEFDVIALTDRQKTMIGAVAMKKIGLTEKGKAYAGVTIENQKLINLTARVLRKLDWVGPVECEFIRDQKGSFHLIEVNGRFPSWLYLAAVAGQNLPLLTVKLALGLPVLPLKDYIAGKLFLRTVTDTVIDPHTLTELAVLGEAAF
jgi:carbamoyl-phosphate synthase large subunit